jgi:hypothetical protein
MRWEQASYRPTHYGMRAQDHGTLLATPARKVNGRYALPRLNAYRGHARKPLELPPAIARDFVRDMRAFFAEKNHQGSVLALGPFANSQFPPAAYLHNLGKGAYGSDRWRDR